MVSAARPSRSVIARPAATPASVLVRALAGLGLPFVGYSM
jgi:hypothetical protein